MRSRRKVVAGALGAVAALVLAACGGGNAASSGGSGGGNPDANGVHNPSTQKGGTLRYANSGDWDSLDPADTYDALGSNSSGRLLPGSSLFDVLPLPSPNLPSSAQTSM